MDLERRLERLEAVESVRAAFTGYAQFMDAGLVEELLHLFDPEAEFVAMNEPPGTGGEVRLRGRADIEKHYRALPFGWFRHHTTNTSIDVSDDARHAELSSYFLTSFPGGVQGGLYEMQFQVDSSGAWRIRSVHIASSWGWGATGTGFHYFDQLGDNTLRGGRPVMWGRTIAPAKGATEG